ncbi:MAG: alpha/beta hydrolase [Gemmatimonadota bacterium]
MGARRLLTFAGIAVAAVVVWAVFTTVWLWRNQERVVFQPPAVGAPDPAAARRVEIRAGDGNPTFAYVVTPPVAVAARPTVVLAFHGNADLAAWQVPWAQELAQRSGVVVVVAEYRGYAGVVGKPTYRSAADDARGALAFVNTLKPGRVVLYGHSLGTAIAAELAAEMTAQAPSALVLQSPFTSARDMAARMLVPVVSAVWSRITRVHYDTHKLVRLLDVPVWVSHGSLDLTIPARMGRDVSDASRRKGPFLLVQGAGHNDVADVGGERYWQWLTSAVTGNPVSAAVTELEQKRGRSLP